MIQIPHCSAHTTYPVGHPKLHVLNKDVQWTRPEDNPYPLAVLKVLVTPPRRNIIPVLPLRHKGRLTFPLCSHCVRLHSGVGWRRHYRCDHTNQQRQWVGTYASIELNRALEEGYVVQKVLRVLEWEEGDPNLFRPYIAEFMAQKIEASDFPKGVKGNPQKEEEYLRECADMFGIKLDRRRMRTNKGRRALAKLMLNSLCAFRIRKTTNQ